MSTAACLDQCRNEHTCIYIYTQVLSYASTGVKFARPKVFSTYVGPGLLEMLVYVIAILPAAVVYQEYTR